MANRFSFNAGPSSSFTDNSSDAADNEPVTLAEFLHFRTGDWPQPSDFERRQRRRTEADVPPRYRRVAPQDRTISTGEALTRRPPRSNVMQDLPAEPPSSRPMSSPQAHPPLSALRETGSLEPVPKWQPDHEVSACPVCKTTFSFFFRKHHCRKCGRVVCNNCSPHRITIPRQYVVQPPNGDDAEAPEAYPARNLGGGEVVRVCRPCVPDPWTPEGAREASTQARPREASTTSSHSGDAARVRQRYRSHVGTQAPLPPPSGRMRAQSHQPTPSYNILDRAGAPSPAHNSFGGRNIPIQAGASSSSRPRHRYTQSSANAPPPYQTYDPRTRPLSAALNAGSAGPPQHRPRRQVREEDECPVCGEELPPGDEIRTAHIEECIITRFGTPSQHPPPSTPPTTTTGRPRASTFRPRGMAVYKATEKDCADAAGEAQECVICFEEFQPGDELGRMECLCKFHRACIRAWWETKGAGSCPTHQLQRD